MKKSCVKCQEVIGNKNVLIYSLILGNIYLLVEAIARILDWYRVIPWIDIITHFLSGAAIGVFVYWYIQIKKHDERIFITLIYVYFIGIIWEYIEVLEESIWVEKFPHLRDVFLWDGFFDIVFHVLGAAIAISLFKYFKYNTRWFKGTSL